MSQLYLTRCCVLLLAGTIVAVQPTPTHALELEDYVTEVVESNPVVREQVHTYRQVAQDYRIALAGWRPSLDLEASAGRFSREAPNTSQTRKDFTSSEATLTLTQNLFAGFDTTHEIGQAQALISSAAYRLYDTADNVALDAIQAYFEVLQEARLVELAKDNVESHERILGQIIERNESGIGLLSEVEQTEGRVAQAHASLIAQQNNLRDAMSRAHQFLGRYVDPSVLEEPEVPPEPPEGFQEVLAGALAVHPAILSAASNIEASRLDYRRSQSSNYPSLDLQLQQNLSEDTNGVDGSTDERSVQLVLRYNLFRGGADRAEQRKAVSVLYEDKAFLDRVRRQVIDTLNLAWAADRSIREQLPYLRTHVEKARQTLDTYYDEFALNLRDLIDLLDAESELNTARIRLAEARYESAVARYRIYEGAGDLLPVLGLDVDLSDDNPRIASLEAMGLDDITAYSETDADSDALPAQQDQCDNSGAGEVDAYGCEFQPSFEVGYPGSGQTPEPVDDNLKLELDGVGELIIPPDALLGNDVDPDGDELSLLGFTQPAHGELRLDFDGNLVYVPDADFTGDDTFSYTVGDTRSRSAVANVNLELHPASVVPEAAIIRFGYKKSTLTPASQVTLDNIVESLHRRPDARVEVYTYTDNIGSASYNRGLSEERAQTIKQLFIDRGIDASRIGTHGMGENNPVADNTTEAGRSQNRRAEIRFVSP